MTKTKVSFIKYIKLVVFSVILAIYYVFLRKRK